MHVASTVAKKSENAKAAYVPLPAINKGSMIIRDRRMKDRLENIRIIEGNDLPMA